MNCLYYIVSREKDREGRKAGEKGEGREGENEREQQSFKRDFLHMKEFDCRNS